MMRLSVITLAFLASLFFLQALATPIDYEYGVWRTGPGWVCSRPTCYAVSPRCGRPSCCGTCSQLPVNSLLPCCGDCCCGTCSPLPLAKTTTCTTVPHSAPLCAKTTTCTTVPHPVCGKMTTCTTVPHAAPCCGKTTACTTLPHYIPTASPLMDPCAKTICTSVPTPCGPKDTCCTTVPTYIQLPCGAVPCGSYGNPPCTCSSW